MAIMIQRGGIESVTAEGPYGWLVKATPGPTGLIHIGGGFNGAVSGPTLDPEDAVEFGEALVELAEQELRIREEYLA